MSILSRIGAHTALCLALVSLLASGAAAQTEISGTLSDSQSWDLAGSPYRVVDTTVVAPGVVLTIEAGVSVELLDRDALFVEGTLIAAGTEAAPVRFSGAAGAWYGPHVRGGGRVDLVDVDFEAPRIGLTLVAPDQTLDRLDGLVFADVAETGVLAGAGSVSLTDAAFSGDPAAPDVTLGLALTDCDYALSGVTFATLDRGVRASEGDGFVERTVFDGVGVAIYARVADAEPGSLELEHVTLYETELSVFVEDVSGAAALAIRTWRTLFVDSEVPTGDAGAYTTWYGQNISNGAVLPAGVNPGEALLVDAAGGDFRPTQRSLTRLFDPVGEGAVGALPYDGAPTPGDGLFGLIVEDVAIGAGENVDVPGDLWVRNGSTLTIGAGATLRFAPSDLLAAGDDRERVELRVEGSLHADGTVAEPVSLLPRVGEAPGSWGGVVVKVATESLLLRQVVIEGATDGITTGTDLAYGEMRISGCTNSGIRFRGGRAGFTGVQLVNNTVGTLVDGGAKPTFYDSVIAYNEEAGVRVAADAYVALSRTLVVWNDGNGVETSSSALPSVSLSRSIVSHNLGTGVLYTGPDRISTSSWASLSSSALTNNGGWGVDAGEGEARPRAGLLTSNVWGNSAGSCRDPVWCTGGFRTEDPQYADPESLDFHPTEFSYHRGGGFLGGGIGPFDWIGAQAPTIEGWVWADRVFPARAEPYVLSGLLTVASEVSATFSQGSEWVVAEDPEAGIFFDVDSRPGFNALAEPVVFRSVVPGTASRWAGLRFGDTSHVPLIGVRVEDARCGICIEDGLIDTLRGIHTERCDVGVSLASHMSATLDRSTLIGDGDSVGLVWGRGTVTNSLFAFHDVAVQGSVSGPTNWGQNTFVSNRVGLEATAADVVYNSVFYGSTTAALTSTGSTIVLRNNTFYPNLTSGLGTRTSVDQTLVYDPLLFDPPQPGLPAGAPRTFDARLRPGSASIDSGTTSFGVGLLDLAGNTRGQGMAVDRGAYEATPTALAPPTANAVAPEGTLVRDEPATFDGRASVAPAGIASATWRFSDGSVASGLLVQHAMSLAGDDHWAQLTIVDGAGSADSDLVVVDVNARPIADAGAEVRGFIDEPLLFDGSASYDPDHDIVSWAWDFGDGGTARGPVVEHVYDRTDAYEVTLTVVDDEGLSAVDRTYAVVLADSDIVGPLVVHDGVEGFHQPGEAFAVQVRAFDAQGVASVQLHYRNAAGASGQVGMTPLGNDTYRAELPGSAVQAPGVEYWFTASDVATPPNSSVLPEGAPAGGVFGVPVDAAPPTIVHTPPVAGRVGFPLRLEAEASDASGVEFVRVVYTDPEGAEASLTIPVDATTGGYALTFPGPELAAPELRYYIEAGDGWQPQHVGRAPPPLPRRPSRYPSRRPTPRAPPSPIRPPAGPSTRPSRWRSRAQPATPRPG